MKGSILILPKGKFSHALGTQLIDDDAIKSVIADIKNRGTDIPVDYGHESFSSPRAEAAGWLKHGSLYKSEEGLWGKIDWTRDALKKIRDKKFRFLSPVMVFNPARSVGDTLKIEKLVSLGLTNHPNIPSMKPLFNQLRMEEKMDELLAKLKSALEMPPETQDATALESALEQIESAPPATDDLSLVNSALGLEADSPADDAVSLIKELRASAEANENRPTGEEWQALKDELARMEEKELAGTVFNAITGGKLLPAQKEWALGYAKSDPEGFSAFLANSKPVVEMGRIIARQTAAGDAPIDPVQEKVNRMLGISREVFKKYNEPDL